MISKVDFKARNLTSNAGIYLLLENTKNESIFDMIEKDLVFDNANTNRIKMNHIKTMMCGHFIGVNKLERLKLLQNDPLINEFEISVKEPETVSRFLSNFTFKTTQMLRSINFKVFRKLLMKGTMKSINIDIDSSVINVEGHQEGATKGYNPKKPGNRCYNIQFAFCDELKAYITGYMRSGNTHTSNGATDMIKEIVAHLIDLDITFRMDSGYFDEEIINTIESLGCKYLIKAKLYPTLLAKLDNLEFTKTEYNKETTELSAKLDKWDKTRRFVVSRILKPEYDRKQLSLIQGNDYNYFCYVTNTNLLPEEVAINYDKRGNCENYIKESKYDMNVGTLILKSFWANESIFQLMMLTYNLFLLFKHNLLDKSEYRQQIKTFRLKYVFIAAKIIKTARYVIMKLGVNYPYKEVYEKCIM